MKLSRTLCLLLSVSLSQLVMAEESFGDMSARIDELEKKVNGQGPGGEDLVSKDDLESLIAQVKELRGRIEVLEHQKTGAITPSSPETEFKAAAEDRNDLGGDIKDNDMAEDDVEAILKDLGASKPVDTDQKRDQATRKAEKSAPTGTLEKSDDSAQYNQAMALYNKQEYSEAEEAFRYYIKAFPKGKYINQAKLRVAESQLATGSKDVAKEAAAAFAVAYKANPKGANGAQALLGMAKSMKLQGETKKACVVLKKLQADFSKEKSTLNKAKNLAKQYKCA